MKVNILLLGLVLIGVAGCVETYHGERMETGKIIGVVEEETQILQDDGSMLPGESVEIGKKVRVGNAIFIVPYKSSRTFASTLKIGDCVRTMVHIYYNPIFSFSNKERLVLNEFHEVVPCS